MPDLIEWKKRIEQRHIGPVFLNLNDLKAIPSDDLDKRALALAYTKFEEFEMWLNRAFLK